MDGSAIGNWRDQRSRNQGSMMDELWMVRWSGKRDHGSRITNHHVLLSIFFILTTYVVPFVVTYNPALPRISNILRKHFNILPWLRSSNRCKDVFKQPPFVAYRLLVKAQLPVISNTHFSPRSFRCGQNCATCPHITNGLTSYTFYSWNWWNTLLHFAHYF